MKFEGTSGRGTKAGAKRFVMMYLMREDAGYAHFKVSYLRNLLSNNVRPGFDFIKLSDIKKSNHFPLH